MSLTKERRDAMPDEDFAVPGKRKLPIHDETHVRLGWDMVDQTKGLTPEERTEARRRILERAKSYGMSTRGWHIEASIQFEAMAVALPVVEGHPNRAPFKGVLTRVDMASDAPPGGSKGKCVYIASDVATAAIPSLLGMAVDCDPEGDFDGHDARFKIGIITAADVVGTELQIEGFFYANDFPDLWAKIQTEKHLLGFSYECKVRIRDLDADVWHVDSCVFTGAAVLYKDKAAYRTTSLAAKAEDESMNPEEMKKAIAEAVAPLTAKIDAQAKELTDLKAKGASLAGPIIDQVQPHIAACNAAATAMEAAGIGAHPTKGHAAALRHVAASLAAQAVSGHVPHIYRDHDYLPDARVEAGDSAALKAAREAAETNAAALKKVTEQLDALGTQFTDLKAKAFTNAAQPERKTLSTEMTALLAKAGITPDKEGKPMSVAEADKTLEAAGIKGGAAIAAKLKLREAGFLAA